MRARHLWVHGFKLPNVAQAQKEGKNPIDAAIAKIKDVIGDDQVKTGELFADAQIQNFLRPAIAIQGWDEYQKIKENALKGNGTVDKDASKVSQEVAAKSEKAGMAWQRFKVKFWGWCNCLTFLNKYGKIKEEVRISHIIQRLKEGTKWKYERLS